VLEICYFDAYKQHAEEHSAPTREQKDKAAGFLPAVKFAECPRLAVRERAEESTVRIGCATAALP
jgi:hypothetical protein